VEEAGVTVEVGRLIVERAGFLMGQPKLPFLLTLIIKVPMVEGVGVLKVQPRPPLLGPSSLPYRAQQVPRVEQGLKGEGALTEEVDGSLAVLLALLSKTTNLR
jgi:hypothetical protein